MAKAAPKSEKTAGIIVAVAFIISIVLFVVFAILGKVIWSCIVLGCGMASIIIAGIVHAIREKIYFNRAVKASIENGDRLGETMGFVAACVIYSETGYSSGGSRGGRRITNVVYKVVVDINGELRNAYSKKFYNEGDPVKVAMFKYSDMCYIIEYDSEK